MKRFSVICGLLLSCAACDDFLSKTPSDELIPESTQAFSELLLEEGYPATMGIDKMTYYMDDDVENNYPPSSGSSWNPGGYSEEDITNRSFYTWQPYAVNDIMNETSGDGFVTTQGYVPWKDYYESILGCNVVIKEVDASEGTEVEKNYLKGEALALRAFHYFNLVNLYGWPYNAERRDPKTSLGVPIITDPEIGQLSFPRNTVAQVYALIVEDIEHSFKCFEKGKKATTKYRMSALAAHCVASRIYLYLENWDEALRHARMVMGEKALPDYTTLSAEEQPLFYPENDDILWLYGHQDNVWCFKSGSSSAFIPSSQLYALFDEEGLTDCRKAWFFSESEEGTDENTKIYIAVEKYSQDNKDYGQGLRATEAYLNAIEALLEKYKKGDNAAGSEAVKLLSDFRERRYVSIDGSITPKVEMKSADELIEIYRRERRKELCYEGQRWFDLRRFGMPRIEKRWSVDGTSIDVYVLEEHDPLYVLDIPSYVTDFNSGIELNESLPSPRLPQQSL